MAPLNQISLLRLELCAASLFTRLVHVRGFTHVRKVYVYVDKLHGGIRMDSRSSFMKTVNRVIQTALPEVQWHHGLGKPSGLYITWAASGRSWLMVAETLMAMTHLGSWILAWPGTSRAIHKGARSMPWRPIGRKNGPLDGIRHCRNFCE